MSGGSGEYMAAYMDDQVGTSGFKLTDLTETYKNYVDKYSSESNITSYDKRILGDATGEMGPFYKYYDGDGQSRNHNSWYIDASDFISNNTCWFVRGGIYSNGRNAGQFRFTRQNGNVSKDNTIRLVLALYNN